jgi:beta-xylosidase
LGDALLFKYCRLSTASIFILLALLALPSCGEEDNPSSESPTFKNPVYDTNFPDPHIIRADGEYYAYSTNDSGANVPTLRSENLVDWTVGEDAMPQLAPWTAPGMTWAPEVLHREDDKYVLYYTAATAAAGKQCIGHALSDSPGGPFVDRDEEPFICQVDQGGSIDASPFVDDGATYLFWKNDGNCCGLDTFIYAQKLSANGLEREGEPVKLLTQDAAWEGDLVEAPVMWKHADKYYLFFSANAYYNESYAVGYATCEGPLGPCEDAPENPILKTANGAAGPGHTAIVEDDDADTWMAYHAWPPDAIGSTIPGRTLWVDQLTWQNGKPVVEGPTKDRQPVP